MSTPPARPAAPESALFELPDMHCGGCAARVRRQLAPLTLSCEPDLASRTVALSWDAARTREAEIIAALQRAGFAPRRVGAAATGEDADERQAERAVLLRIAVAALLTMQVMMLALAEYLGAVDDELVTLMRLAQWLLVTPVVFYAGGPFLASALGALSQHRLNMDVPVSLATVGAWALSAVNLLRGQGEVYFDSAAMFVTLLSLGRWAEGWGRRRAARRLRELLAAEPGTALREQGGDWVPVPIHALSPGDRVRVRPGEGVPADGRLLDESANLQEGLLTGESLPVTRQAGERVLGGSVNVGRRALHLELTAVGEQTVLDRIRRMSRNALAARPAFVNLADAIAGRFIAFVLIAALVSALGWAWYEPSRVPEVVLAVLVASCPCALSLAVPVSLAAGIGRLAGRGVLVARAEGLLRAARLDGVAFDKTGTLTDSGCRLAEMRLADGAQMSRTEALSVAAALERHALHPLAQAFATVVPAEVEAVSVERRGVRGRWRGQVVELRGLAPAEADALALAEGRTLLGLHADGVLQAGFAVAATPREEARAVLEALRERGLEVWLFSGDRAAATAPLAAALGIRHWEAGLRPEDKPQRLRATGRRLMAVGDGVNDGPFLAVADVGVAMGAGAVSTQHEADLILLEDRLQGLPGVIDEARALRRRMRQNIAWAVGYNLAVFPLAVSGLLAPWLAALGMSASSLLVTLNALRRGRA